jgi:hypothetical protein
LPTVPHILSYGDAPPPPHRPTNKPSPLAHRTTILSSWPVAAIIPNVTASSRIIMILATTKEKMLTRLKDWSDKDDERRRRILNITISLTGIMDDNLKVG